MPLGALVLSAAAAQQTWAPGLGDVKYQLTGCERQASNDVQCEVLATYTGQAINARKQWRAEDNVATDVTGRQYPADSIAVGNTAATRLATVYLTKNTPVRLVYTFKGVPAGNTLRSLAIAEGRLENVAIRPYVKPPAPTVTLPPVNSGSYTIQLSNCTPTTNGAFTCTGATFTPNH